MRFLGKDRILVIKMRYIGDVLLITPFLRALRKGYPGAKISVLVNKGTEETLENNPYIDEAITFDRSWGLTKQMSFIRKLKKEEFETTIDLTNSDRSAWIARFLKPYSRVGIKGHKNFRNKRLYNILLDIPNDLGEEERNLEVGRQLGLRRLEPETEIFLLDEEVEKAMALIKDVKKPYAVFHPGARRWYKSWPTERFAELADRTVRAGVEVVICGGSMDVENAGKIESAMTERATNIAGKTTIRDLAVVERESIFFVGNDSAPMHIACSMGATTIGLFGPTDFRRWHPIGKKHFVFAHDVDCSPCGHSKDCDKGDKTCMRLITVDEVYEAVEYILEQRAIEMQLEAEAN